MVPTSIMPAYPWLDDAVVDPSHVQTTMLWLRRLGAPDTDEDIAGVFAQTKGMTEMDALVAYLQSLGKAPGGS